MTSSLVLHLHGPLQAWGSRSRFDTRSTEAAPTKSAIVGMLAAALGRRRGSSVEDLAALLLTTRVDRPGRILRDYHTVGAAYPQGQRLRRAEDGRERSDPIVSERFYLADAAFTVAITGRAALIDELDAALRRPRWALALGRRCCPPAEPFLLGRSDDDPVQILEQRLPVVRDTQRNGTSVTFTTDDPAGDQTNIRDQPGRTLGDWANYRTRAVRTWACSLDDERFTTDSFQLVEAFAEVLP